MTALAIIVAAPVAALLAALMTDLALLGLKARQAVFNSAQPPIERMLK